MGGTVANPTYRQVCTKTTGHAETVEVVYDTRKLTTRALLTEFFTLHNFTVDRSEAGGQYRSAIFLLVGSTHGREQEQTAQALLVRLADAGFVPATQLRWEKDFFPADARHQQYCSARGIVPKKGKKEGIREILTLQ